LSNPLFFIIIQYHHAPVKIETLFFSFSWEWLWERSRFHFFERGTLTFDPQSRDRIHDRIFFFGTENQATIYSLLYWLYNFFLYRSIKREKIISTFKKFEFSRAWNWEKKKYQKMWGEWVVRELNFSLVDCNDALS
jgi:hypothetical protein